MNKRLKNMIWFFFSFYFGLLLVGCTETKSDVNSAGTKVKPIKFQSNSASLQSRERIEGVWQMPILLGSASIPVSMGGDFAGPVLGDIDNGYFNSAFRIYSEFSFSTGTFLSGNTEVKSKDLTGNWVETSPIPMVQKSTASIPEYAYDEKSGTVYAVWGASTNAGSSLWRNGDIYFNTLQKGSVWGTPELIGQGEWSRVTVDTQGKVSVIWQENDSLNPIKLHAKQFTPGIGWSSVSTISRHGATQLAASPVIDSKGNVVLAWMEFGYPDSLAKLYNATYSANTGWSNPLTIIDSSSYVDNGAGGLTLIGSIKPLNLAIDLQTDNMELIYFRAFTNSDGDEDKGLYSVSYNSGIGWQSARTIDNNNPAIFYDGAHNLQFSVDNNNNGNVLAIWRETQTDEIGQFDAIFSNYYSPATGWSGALQISHRIESATPTGGITPASFQFTVSGSIDQNGNAVAAWSENSTGLSEVFASYLDPSLGWGMQELVVSYTGPGHYANWVNTELDGNGVMNVAWRERSSNQIEVLFNAWVNEHAVDSANTGIVVTPPVFSPPDNNTSAPVVAANWTMPLEIWNSGAVDSSIVNLTPINAQLDNQNNGYLSFGIYNKFDPIMGNFIISENIAVSNLGSTSWIDNSPIPVVDQNIAQPIRTAFDSNTGDLYAVWRIGRELYFNVRGVTGEWGSAQVIGSNSTQYDIFVADDGAVSVVWASRTFTNATVTLNVTRYLPGSLAGAGIQPTQSRSIIDGVNSAFVFAMDAQGFVTVAWAYTDPIGTPPLFDAVDYIRVSQYSPLVGWGSIELANEMPFSKGGLAQNGLQLAPGNNGSVLLFIKYFLSGLSTTYYRPGTGWSELTTNIDNNANTTDYMFKSPPSVAFNDSGNALVAWSERLTSALGEEIYEVRSTLWSPTSLSWSLPVNITPGIASNATQPMIAMDVNGHVIAAWIGIENNVSTLYTNHFHLDSGWNPTPEKVVVYAAGSDTTLMEPRVTVNSSGKMMLVWKQVTTTGLVDVISVLLTKRNL